MGKKIYGLDLNNIGAESITTKRGVADSECSYIELDFIDYTDNKANADYLFWEYQNNQDYLWEVYIEDSESESESEGSENTIGNWYRTKLVFAPSTAPNMIYYLIFDNYGYKLCTPKDISELKAVYLMKHSGSGPK